MFDKWNDRFIQAFRNGEEWAFSEIYCRFGRPIQRFVSQKVRDEEAARDISQEIFLKVHRFRDSYRAEFALSTWIWTIARNTITDWFKRDDSRDTEGQVEDLPCQAPNAEKLLERETERARFAGFLGCLTELQKKVLWMRLVHHLSYQEIASSLGLSLSAVKCLVYRAKRALGQMGHAATLVNA
ncbi:MAG: sigma-70 family RNA polymerase sigma factor [Oligoflexia bacterium]|nr:sigma-70 family RNA polymerase sigma factor [Oligoflexia bacterium]